MASEPLCGCLNWDMATDGWIIAKTMYVDPSDRSLHTNQIEGLWNKFKKWLPQAGNYNLEEYLYLFMWMEEQKQLGNDPFWALVVLVAADNSLVTLKESMSRQEKLEKGIVMNLMKRKTRMSMRTLVMKIWSCSTFTTASGAKKSFVRNKNFWSTSELVTTCSSLLFTNKNDNN